MYIGTEEFWIPAAIAALGTGAQAVNENQAKSRQNAAEVQAIGNQQQYRAQANSGVKDLTNQIEKNNPNQIAAKETGDFVNTLRQNQGGKDAGGAPTSALAPVGGANSRYGADVANSKSQVQQYGDTTAHQMSAVDAAIRQRQNEGLAQQSLNTNLNLLGAQSQSKNFVDQLRAQAAGQANPWGSLFSGILKNGANAYAMNAGGSSAPANQWYSETSPGTAPG